MFTGSLPTSKKQSKGKPDNLDSCKKTAAEIKVLMAICHSQAKYHKKQTNKRLLTHTCPCIELICHSTWWYSQTHNNWQKNASTTLYSYVAFFSSKLCKLTAVWKLCFVLSTEAFVFQWLLCHFKLLHDCVIKSIPLAFVWVSHVAAPSHQTAIRPMLPMHMIL